MATLSFELPDGSTRNVEVTHLLNAGYAGREQDEVQAHIEELALLGVPGPTTTPALYPVSPYLAQQASEVRVQHGRTSGEAEWAMVITEDGVLLTVACDHTDRDLEVHGVAWSKNASPDVLGRKAWRLDDVRDHLDRITLKGWVGEGDEADTLIQDSTLGALLTPGLLAGGPFGARPEPARHRPDLRHGGHDRRCGPVCPQLEGGNDGPRHRPLDRSGLHRGTNGGTHRLTTARPVGIRGSASCECSTGGRVPLEAREIKYLRPRPAAPLPARTRRRQTRCRRSGLP